MMGNARLHLVAQQSVEMPVCPSGSDSLGNALHPALNSPAWALPAPAGTPLCPRATAAAPAPHFHTLPSLLLPTSTTQTFFLAASRGLQLLFKEEGPAQAVEQILVGFAGFLGLSQCLGDRHQMINCCISALVPSQLPLQGGFAASPALKTIKGPAEPLLGLSLAFVLLAGLSKPQAGLFPPHNSHLCSSSKAARIKAKGAGGASGPGCQLGLARAGLANAHPWALGLGHGWAQPWMATGFKEEQFGSSFLPGAPLPSCSCRLRSCRG